MFFLVFTDLTDANLFYRNLGTQWRFLWKIIYLQGFHKGITNWYSLSS
jgi:hypothetical protein